ncbi:MAG TPA: FtsX-like permease family protein [Chloroflexia bacterium]|nr:FtsX-like permease family protein [Chloroflexia bacterium]
MQIAIRKAYRDLTRRRLRSFLTIIGIIIGVAGIVAITSTSKNMTAAQAAAYNNNSQQDMRWWLGIAPDAVRQAVEQVPNVDAADLRATYSTKWYANGAWRDILFNGIRDFSDMKVNRIDLVEGNWPNRGEVLLEASVREIAPVQIGDEVAYRAGPGNESRFLRVAGFAKSPSYPSATVLGTSVGYTLNTEVHKMYGHEGDNQILVRLRDFSSTVRADTRSNIERVFAKRNLAYGSYWERNPDDYVGKRQLDALVALMTVFSIVGLVISSFLVANTLAAVISEQMGEIGAMKAIGAGAGKVIWIYVVAGMMYGVVGTVLGLLVGVFGGYALLLYLGSLFNLTIRGLTLDPMDMLQGVAVGVGVTTLAAWLPAWRGTSISVRKALESYGISTTFGQGWLDRAVQRMSKLPRVPAMAVRNLARRKGRNAITIGAIGLATAAFLAAQGTSDSVHLSIENAYDVYGADAWVWFNNPVGQGFAATLRSVPEVEEVEAWASSRASIGDTFVTMWGLPVHTGLYRAPITRGRWFTEEEPQGAVLSSSFAASRNLGLGDSLELSVGGEDGRFTVVGMVNDNAQGLQSSSKGKVFVPIDTAARLMHRSGAADFFAVRFDRSDGPHVEEVLGRIERKYHDLSPGMLAAYADKESSLEASKILGVLLYAMTVIVGTIGGIGIANTLTLNVLERRREIGIMRSLGGRNSHLVSVFITEALVMGVFGFLLGLALGYPLARLLVWLMSTVLFPLDFVFPLEMVATAMLFTLFLTTVASIGPALGAARLKVSQALRYE